MGDLLTSIWGSTESGEGTSDVTVTLPPELTALTAEQANQMRALGVALPITQFAAPHPSGTAGINPMQEAAFQRAVLMGLPTQGLEALLGLATPVSALSMGATSLANTPAATQAALDSLGIRLGVAPGTGTDPNATIGAQVGTMMAPTMPLNRSMETVFPGLSASTLFDQALTLPTMDSPQEFAPSPFETITGTPPPPPASPPPAPAPTEAPPPAQPTISVDPATGELVIVDPVTGQVTRIAPGGSFTNNSLYAGE